MVGLKRPSCGWCAVLSEQHDDWQVGKRQRGVLGELERKEEMAEQPELVAG